MCSNCTRFKVYVQIINYILKQLFVTVINMLTNEVHNYYKYNNGTSNWLGNATLIIIE